MNVEYYSSLLVQLKDILKGKRRGKSPRGSCSSLATQKKLAYLDFQCLDHPPYSPDPAPSDTPPVPWSEKIIEGSPFLSDLEVNAAAET